MHMAYQFIDIEKKHKAFSHWEEISFEKYSKTSFYLNYTIVEKIPILMHKKSILHYIALMSAHKNILHKYPKEQFIS